MIEFEEDFLKRTFIFRLIENLSEEAKTFALVQLLMYPETKDFILNCAKEFDKLYSFKN